MNAWCILIGSLAGLLFLAASSDRVRPLRERVADWFLWVAAIWLSKLPLSMLWPMPGSRRRWRAWRSPPRKRDRPSVPLTRAERDESECLLRAALTRPHPSRSDS